MSDETLLSAARRVVRFFNIDMNKGGLITEDTQQAIDILDLQVRRMTEAEKKERERDNRLHPNPR